MPTLCSARRGMQGSDHWACREPGQAATNSCRNLRAASAFARRALHTQRVDENGSAIHRRALHTQRLLTNQTLLF
jgi:hypothetical protein